MVSEIEKLKRQIEKLNKKVIHLEEKTKKLKKANKAKKNVTYIKNPITKRQIMTTGVTFKRLVKKNIITKEGKKIHTDIKPKGIKQGTKKGFIIKPTDDIQVVPLKLGSKVITIHPFELQKGYHMNTLKKKISRYISKFDGRAKITAKFNGLPRSGKWVDTKNPDFDYMLFEPGRHLESWKNPKDFFNELKDRIYDFDIYIEEEAGGCNGDDEFNDCLFECISEAFNGNQPRYTDPYQMKKAMNLGRKALIPISKLDVIEKSLSTNIEVIGDVVRHSKTNHKRVMTLILRKHHYTLYNPRKDKPPFGVYDKPRDPMIYEFCKEGVKILKHKKEHIVTKEEFSEDLKHLYKTIPYDSKEYKTMRKHLKAYNKERKRLLDVSNGVIDPNRALSTAMGTVGLWYNYIKIIPEPEKIKKAEAGFIQPFQHGGMIWATKYDGQAYNYDINHFYPSILSDPVMIPIKCGEMTTLDELPTNIKYGLYCCEIEKKEWKGCPLFTYMKNNRYTHYDIKRARELGLKIKMCDVSPNAEIFSVKELIRSEFVFKNYIKWEYELKKKEPLVKFYGNALWGALCQSQEFSTSITLGEENRLNLHDDRKIVDFVRVGKKITIKYENPNVKYATNWARLGPFLTSLGRSRMSRYVEKYHDSVIKVHTDSITSSKPLPIPLSSELGGWKLDKEGHVIIKHATSIKWE